MLLSGTAVRLESSAMVPRMGEGVALKGQSVRLLPLHRVVDTHGPHTMRGRAAGRGWRRRAIRSNTKNTRRGHTDNGVRRRQGKGGCVVAMHGALAVEACSVRLELKPTGVNLNLPLTSV